MKNMKHSLILASAMLMATASQAVERQYLDHTIEQSRINTKKSASGLSVLNGKLAFTRNDTVYIAEMNDSLDIKSLKPMDDLSKLGMEGQFAQYGKTIIYSKNGELYQAELVNNEWKKAQKVQIEGLGGGRTEIKGTSLAARRWTYKVPVVKGLYNPAISKNGKRLYYVASFEGGVGGKDIWYSDRNADGKTWSAPVNLGDRINTSADEDFPFLAGDTAFYFTTTQSGVTKGTNIFKTSLKTASKPYIIPEGMMEQEMLAKFNTDSNDENFVVVSNCPFLISNRDGRNNIYRPQRVEVIKVEEEPADTTPAETVPADTLPTDNALADNDLKVVKKDYKTYIFYFDFNKTSLIDSYENEFKYIYEFISANPGSNFMINGHTDTRGSETYNQKLSVNRAKIVCDRLVKMGIDRKRMVFQGFGESQPQIRDAQTEEEHQKNRRVEIIKLD